MTPPTESLKRILIVEDESELAELVRERLLEDGFNVLTAQDGDDALARIKEAPPDLILLDVMLPGRDGFSVCRALQSKAETRSIPIIFVTARDTDSDELLGLELGARDYVSKPFHLEVLVSRIHKRIAEARARKVEAEAGLQKVEVGAIRLDTGSRQAFLAGKPVSLTPNEFRILEALCRRPDEVVSRQELLQALDTSDQHSAESRVIDVHILAVRRKLGEHGRRILTVRGQGYRLVREERDQGESQSRKSA